MGRGDGGDLRAGDGKPREHQEAGAGARLMFGEPDGSSQVSWLAAAHATLNHVWNSIFPHSA